MPVVRRPHSPTTITARRGTTFDDIAVIAAEVAGRSVTCTITVEDEWVADHVSHGTPEVMARFTLGIYQARPWAASSPVSTDSSATSSGADRTPSTTCSPHQHNGEQPDYSLRTTSTEISTAGTSPRFSSQWRVFRSSGQPTPGP
jgi:hypothetical protein